MCNTFLRRMSKNTKAWFALNIGHFYLASELPRGENCHILAVDVLQFWGESQSSQAERVMQRVGDGGGVLPKVLRVV